MTTNHNAAEVLEKAFAAAILAHFSEGSISAEYEVKVAANTNEEWLAIVTMNELHQTKVAAYLYVIGQDDNDEDPRFILVQGDEQTDSGWPDEFTIVIPAEVYDRINEDVGDEVMAGDRIKAIEDHIAGCLNVDRKHQTMMTTRHEGTKQLIVIVQPWPNRTLGGGEVAYVGEQVEQAWHFTRVGPNLEFPTTLIVEV